jgi:hypothetical protein
VGQQMQTPVAPFRKLEPDIVEKENAAEVVK